MRVFYCLVCLAFGTSAAVAACSSGHDATSTEEAVHTDQEAMIGGTLTDAHPEVGVMEWDDDLTPGDHGASCTAVLITDRHFVTAAHCIEFRPFVRSIDRYYPEWDLIDHPVEIKFNGRKAKHIFSHGTTRLGIADWAVGELYGSYPLNGASPATIASSLEPTRPSTLIGYGCTNRSTPWDSGQKRYLTYPWSPAPYEQFPWPSSSNSNPQWNWFMHSGCPGDSGGPLFLGTLTDTGGILGLMSGGTGGDNVDMYANLVYYRDDVYALVNAMSYGDICYRVRSEYWGWMPPACDGTPVGTGGTGAIEAVQIWSNKPGVEVCYRAHVQNIGWQDYVCNGDVAGTIDQSLRMEALQITTTPPNYYLGWQCSPSWYGDGACDCGCGGQDIDCNGDTSLAACDYCLGCSSTWGCPGDINPTHNESCIYNNQSYQAYAQGIGWMTPVGQNQVAGTTGQSRRMEGLRASLSGQL